VIAAPQAHPHLQAGRQLVLRSDVLFSLGSATLTDRSKLTLVRLAQSIAAAHLKGTIQINGYTDNTGTAASNVALSLARALAVARVLQAPLAGEAVTLVPQGFGETSPVATNSTVVGQASNRRVTIVLPNE
jgi:outer membrane protein OmpA-like peptidoglycan-associated protein